MAAGAGGPRSSFALGWLCEAFASEVTSGGAQPSFDCDKCPFNLVESRQNRIVGVGSAAVRHFGDPLSDIRYHCGERGEFGCVRIHRCSLPVIST